MAVSGDTSSTVLGVVFTGLAGSITSLALIDGGLVETSSAVEGTDSADHDVGALVVAGTIVEDLAFRATGAGSGTANTSSTAVRTVLASVVDGVSSNWAVLEALEVEEVSAAALTSETFAGVFSASSARRVALDASIVLSGGN